MIQLDEIVAGAKAASLPFLVIGGHAVAAHGYARSTIDLDLLAPKKDRLAWKTLLESKGYTLKFETEPFSQWDVPLWENFAGLDMMFVNESTFSKLIGAAVPGLADGTKVQIPSIEHLIALKLHALRNNYDRREFKDLDDITMLMHQNKISAHSESFRELCLKFGTQQIYERILKANG